MKAFFFIYFLILTKGIAQDKFLGVWVNLSNKEEIEIYKIDGLYYAKTLNKLDTINVLDQMIYKSDKKLYGGTYFYDKVNEEFEAIVRLLDENKLMIKLVKGIGILNEKIFFKRKIIE